MVRSIETAQDSVTQTNKGHDKLQGMKKWALPGFQDELVSVVGHLELAPNFLVV